MKADWTALFWKEWRENVRWAVLISLSLSAGLAYAVYSELGRTAYNNSGDIPVWNSANLIFTIAAPLAGLALGLLQILPELRRDQWAFLVHRPATRTTLFLGKVVPGLCLYALSVSLPLLGLAAWDAAPGHVAAPFDFRFTLAGWAAVLAGLPFYFAGLLAALRPARWYGSRALPVVAALSGPVAAAWYTEFWQAALFGVLSAAVFGIAAWGSFGSSGDYSVQPKPARSTLGVVVYIGILGVLFALTSLTFALKEAVFPLPDSAYPSISYSIDTAGRILKVTQDRPGNAIRTLLISGKPLSPHALTTGAQDENYLTVTALVGPPWRTGSSAESYSKPQRYVQPLQTFLFNGTDTAWYFVEGTHQIEGYSERTRMRVGYLGPQGFSQSNVEAGQFPERLISSDHQNNTGGLLQFPHSAYRFDTERKKLTLLWPGAASGSIEGACYLTQENRSRTGSTGAYFIVADGRIQVFSDSGTLLLNVPRAYPESVYPSLSVAMNLQSQKYYFWYAHADSSPPEVLWSPSQIVTVASTGRTLQTTSLPPAYTRSKDSPIPAVAGALVPPGLGPAYLGSLLLLRAAGDTKAYAEWQSLTQAPGLPGLLAVSALFGLLSASLAWLICRRCGDSRRGQAAWAFGTFWLGLYGVGLLLALRAWPARVLCPNCGRRRVVTRAGCEHCAAPFARPEPDGTEIFDADRSEDDAAREPAGR